MDRPRDDCERLREGLLPRWPDAAATDVEAADLQEQEVRRHQAHCPACSALLDERTRMAQAIAALPRHRAAEAPSASLQSFRSVQEAALRREEAQWRPRLEALPRHRAPARLVRRVRRALRGGRARRWVVVQAPWLAAAAALLLWVGVGMPGTTPTAPPTGAALELGESIGPIVPVFVEPEEYEAHGLRTHVERRHGWAVPEVLGEGGR